MVVSKLRHSRDTFPPATRRQHILNHVGDVRRVARIVDQSGKRSGYRPAALGKRKQDHAAVRGKTAIECGCDFLARHC